MTSYVGGVLRQRRCARGLLVTVTEVRDRVNAGDARMHVVRGSCPGSPRRTSLAHSRRTRVHPHTPRTIGIPAATPTATPTAIPTGTTTGATIGATTGTTTDVLSCASASISTGATTGTTAAIRSCVSTSISTALSTALSTGTPTGTKTCNPTTAVYVQSLAIRCRVHHSRRQLPQCVASQATDDVSARRGDAAKARRPRTASMEPTVMGAAAAAVAETTDRSNAGLDACPHEVRCDNHQHHHHAQRHETPHADSEILPDMQNDRRQLSDPGMRTTSVNPRSGRRRAHRRVAAAVASLASRRTTRSQNANAANNARFARESTRLRSNVADRVHRDLLPAGRLLSMFLVAVELLAELGVMVMSGGQPCDRPLRLWVRVLILLQTATIILHGVGLCFGRDAFHPHRLGLSATDVDMYMGSSVALNAPEPASTMRPAAMGTAPPASLASSAASGVTLHGQSVGGSLSSFESTSECAGPNTLASRDHTTDRARMHPVGTSSGDKPNGADVHFATSSRTDHAMNAVLNASAPVSSTDISHSSFMEMDKSDGSPRNTTLLCTTSSEMDSREQLSFPSMRPTCDAVAAPSSRTVSLEVTASSSGVSVAASTDRREDSAAHARHGNSVGRILISADTISAPNVALPQQGSTFPNCTTAHPAETTPLQPNDTNVFSTPSAAGTVSGMATRPSQRFSVVGWSASIVASNDVIDRCIRFANAWYLVWFVIGAVWASDTGTCADTAPHLYRLAVALIVIYFALLFLPLALFCIIVCCLPLFILVYRIMLPYAERERRRARAVHPAQIAELTVSQPYVRGGAFGGGDATKEARTRGCGPSRSDSAKNTDDYAGASSAALHDSDDDEPSCVICLCAYEEGEMIRTLPCKHHFHARCIDEWLLLDKSCALCKRDVDAKCHEDVKEETVEASESGEETDTLSSTPDSSQEEGSVDVSLLSRREPDAQV